MDIEPPSLQQRLASHQPDRYAPRHDDHWHDLLSSIPEDDEEDEEIDAEDQDPDDPEYFDDSQHHEAQPCTSCLVTTAIRRVLSFLYHLAQPTSKHEP